MSMTMLIKSDRDCKIIITDLNKPTDAELSAISSIMKNATDIDTMEDGLVCSFDRFSTLHNVLAGADLTDNDPENPF